MSQSIVLPWAAYASTPFSTGEKSIIRDYCGYPPYGAGNSGFIGYRFFQASGTLEYRLNNLSTDEIQQVRWRADLIAVMDAALASASSGLDTAQASVWTRNKNEVADRIKHRNYHCRKIADSLGVPVGPNFSGDGSSVRLVV